MSSILLSPEVSASLFVELLLLLILTLAFFHTLVILKEYNQNVMSAYQYELEKRSYLVVTIVWVSLLIKIALLPFFTYTINELSNIIPGAMCGAGVIGSNIYGEPVLALKIFLIILVLLWMLINREDTHSQDNRYFKKKMLFFIVLFLLFLVEIILEILFLTSLSTENPVRCCSSIYIETDKRSALPFNLTILQIVILFYLSFIFIIAAAYWKKRVVLFILTPLFVYISYYVIVYFFSTYVYELPSHQCPFCLLQFEYYYIGYAIFGSLFIATYYAIATSLFRFMQNYFLHVILWYIVFIFLTSSHFIVYIISNGLLL